MKITWLSNAPWARTGYGNQTYLFVPRIQKLGHEIAIIAFYGLEGGILNWNGVRVYPRGYHPYGQDIMSAHSASFGADILVSLMDSWVIETRMLMNGIRWVPWFPVDHEPLPNIVRERVAQAYARVVYSRFGEAMVRQAGLDCFYVPHGVDIQAFQPLAMDEARENLKIPNDKFLVGMVAANKGNPSRKAFTANLAAFAELKRKHPDCLIYLHTTAGEENQGINLPEFIESLGLKWGMLGKDDARTVDVLVCDQYRNLLGFDDQYMRAIYSAFDVHLLVSMGEGFGIPILEAQACGCPVITGDWTSMPEITFSGWTVPKSEADRWWTPLASYQYYPRVGAIVDCLETAYRKKGNQYNRDQARKGALAYDADLIAEKYWKPVLETIHDSLPPVGAVQFAEAMRV